MKKWVITGASGLLGSNLLLETSPIAKITAVYCQNHISSTTNVASTCIDLTLADAPEKLQEAESQPDVVVHAAAWTNVDHCEAEPQLADLRNAKASHYVAQYATKNGARLIHLSTDQVFDGKAGGYKESSDPSPINAYGRSKLRAEELVLKACPSAVVLRTNLYGLSPFNPRSFLSWILGALERDEKLNMFTDVFFTPLSVAQLIALIHALADSDYQGVLNACCDERLSKYEFALRVADVFNLSKSLIQAGSIRNATLKAPRPADMSLDGSRLHELFPELSLSLAEGLALMKLSVDEKYFDRINQWRMQ